MFYTINSDPKSRLYNLKCYTSYVLYNIVLVTLSGVKYLGIYFSVNLYSYKILI